MFEQRFKGEIDKEEIAKDATQSNKSFERDASIECFSSIFLKIWLNACARRGSIPALCGFA